MQVEFFTDKIKREIEKLDIRIQVHIDELIILLEDYGQELRMPYSKPLGKGIFELRVVGITHIRLLYCFYKNKAVILNIIVKKQNKLSNKDILIAIKRKELLA
jgi:phage-related protein